MPPATHLLRSDEQLFSLASNIYNVACKCDKPISHQYHHQHAPPQRAMSPLHVVQLQHGGTRHRDTHSPLLRSPSPHVAELLVSPPFTRPLTPVHASTTTTTPQNGAGPAGRIVEEARGLKKAHSASCLNINLNGKEGRAAT